eukprot:5023012-Prymnesium_polylepis.2
MPFGAGLAGGSRQVGLECLGGAQLACTRGDVEDGAVAARKTRCGALRRLVVARRTRLTGGPRGVGLDCVGGARLAWGQTCDRSTATRRYGAHLAAAAAPVERHAITWARCVARDVDSERADSLVCQPQLDGEASVHSDDDENLIDTATVILHRGIQRRREALSVVDWDPIDVACGEGKAVLHAHSRAAALKRPNGRHATLRRRDAAPRNEARLRLHRQCHLEKLSPRNLLDGRAHGCARIGRDG